jgi:hypothetical protein
MYWTDRDDWMHDLQYAELFDASHTPIPEEEMEITRVLDRLVDEALNHPVQIGQWVNAMRQVDQNTRLVSGRPCKGQQKLATVSGTEYDALLKQLVERELTGGDLQAFRGRLEVIPTRPTADNRAEGRDKGPDFYMETGEGDTRCMVAWDLTTWGSTHFHIRRDVIRWSLGSRGIGPFNRYYVLVWNMPAVQSVKLKSPE